MRSWLRSSPPSSSPAPLHSTLDPSPSTPDTRPSTLVPRFLREPLLHFLLIGAGLFLLFGWRGGPASLPGGAAGQPAAKIVVTQEDVGQLVDVFTRTWQRPPSREEAQSLVEDLVRSEIYYREALAIGLDRDDVVIRRRMRQKMEFIFEDVSALADPKDEDLLIFLKKHSERYLVDPQVAFRHVYVNADKRGKNAESDARQILVQLNEGADPNTVGDTFLLEGEIGLSPLWDIQKQFGETFAQGVSGLKPGKWEGPLRSGFGLHLVRITKRVGGRLPELNEVREKVKLDWAVERQKELKDAAYAKLRERYSVVVEKPGVEVPGPRAHTGAGTVKP